MTRRAQWIKCSDRMPAEGIDVLAFVTDGVTVSRPGHYAVLSLDDTCQREWWDGWRGMTLPLALVTHWQPIDEPPP